MDQKTAHQHWSAYDEKNEMAAWDAVHARLLAGAAPAMDAGEVRQLRDLAFSYGYGEADSFITDFGLAPQDGEDAHAASHRAGFENYEESDYWGCIARSERVVEEAVAGRPDAGALRQAAGAIANAQRESFEAGRKCRVDMEAVPAPGM